MAEVVIRHRCQVCKRRNFRIRKNGTVWNHGNKVPVGQFGWGQNCNGAGLPPAVLAVPECVKSRDGKPDITVWHAPTDPGECDGDCDYHDIACDDENNIPFPWPNRYVPLDLKTPNERWCPECLALFTIPLPVAAVGSATLEIGAA